jgi:hypothetical protein
VSKEIKKPENKSKSTLHIKSLNKQKSSTAPGASPGHDAPLPIPNKKDRNDLL